jgi:prepilin-type N-terminal cleavage/methylation domain-containing protein
MKNKQSGFTLIEIAIVLVIIGLLLGGVLKGQELINSAKVKNLATDFKNIPVYIYGYQDKFKALPGDDKCAYASGTCTSQHMTAPTTVLANSGGSGNGNGNGIIDGSWSDTATTATSEAYSFWQHIRVAGLAPGSTDPTGDFRPTNAVGGSIGVTNVTQSPINTLKGSYIVCSNAIAGKFARQLDITLDDGNPISGSMQITAADTTTPAVPTKVGGGNITGVNDIVDDSSYLVCMGF